MTQWHHGQQRGSMWTDRVMSRTESRELHSIIWTYLNNAFVLANEVLRKIYRRNLQSPDRKVLQRCCNCAGTVLERSWNSYDSGLQAEFSLPCALARGRLTWRWVVAGVYRPGQGQHLTRGSKTNDAIFILEANRPNRWSVFWPQFFGFLWWLDHFGSFLHLTSSWSQLVWSFEIPSMILTCSRNSSSPLVM